MLGGKIIKSLNQRLLLLILFFGTLPLTLAGLIFIHLERRTLVEQAQQELLGVNRAVSQEFDTYLQELLLDARSIASLPDMRSMDPARQQRVLAELLPLYARYGQLTLVDLDGQIQLTGRSQPPANIAHLASFQGAAAGQQSWSIAPNLFDDELTLHMHTPIFGEDGQQAAILGSPVSLDHLAAVMTSTYPETFYEIFIVGPDQRILIHADPARQSARSNYGELLPFSAAPVDPFTLVYTDESGSISAAPATPQSARFSLDGRVYLASYNTLAPLGWTLVTARPQETLLGFSSTKAAFAFASIMLTLLTTNILAIVFTTRLTQPLQHLVAAADALKVGSEQIDLPAADDQDEEIKALIKAFEMMHAAVVARERELRELSASLDQRVQQRTQELMITNKRLADEITMHQQTERALQIAKESAEAASRAKSVFLATMSHELRTPLTAIIGYGELLGELLNEDPYFSDPAEALEDLDCIVRSAHHLHRIIDDVLYLTKIEADRLTVEHEAYRLPDLVDKVIAEIEPQLIQNQNQIAVHIAPELQYGICGDQEKIKVILENLLSNAAKFTHVGEIVVEATIEHELPFGAEMEEWLVLQVRDNGIGIPLEKQRYVFEPFSQVDDSEERRYGGTGVGLALTRRLCHMLDGLIWVESRPAFGSTFTVRLPLQQEWVKQV